MFMHACERNTVYVGVLYSHGCCWVCLFLAYNNGRRWKVLNSRIPVVFFVQFGRGFGVGVSGEGPGLGGPTNGLWVTVVSGAAAVGRDGNPWEASSP